MVKPQDDNAVVQAGFKFSVLGSIRLDCIDPVPAYAGMTRGRNAGMTKGRVSSPPVEGCPTGGVVRARVTDAP